MKIQFSSKIFSLGTVSLLFFWTTLTTQQNKANAITYTVGADVIARSASSISSDSPRKNCTTIFDLNDPCLVETFVSAMNPTGTGAAEAFARAKLSADLKLDVNSVIAGGRSLPFVSNYFARAFTAINGTIFEFKDTLKWPPPYIFGPYTSLTLSGSVNDFASFSLAVQNEDTGEEIAGGEAIFDSSGLRISGNLWNENDWSFQSSDTVTLNKTAFGNILNLPEDTNISVTNNWTVQGENSGSEESFASASAEKVLCGTLFDLFSDPNSTCQVGDKEFSQWTLIDNPDSINLDNIVVEGIFENTNAPGIKFTAVDGALSVPFNEFDNIDLTFDFLVTSLGEPIVDNELILDEFVCEPDFVEPPCIIEIFENVGTSQGSDNLASKSVEYERGIFGPPVRDKQFDQAFFPPQQSVWVRKDINVSSGVEGNTELIVFSQRFSQQTPEPTSILSFLALGTLGAASTLKRKLKSSQSTKKETTKVG